VRRLFWIGAAALLGVAALIAIVALVRGEFTETDGKILATLGITLGAGSVCLVGLALLDRGEARPLGWLAVGVGVAGYAVTVYEIWSDVDSGEWLGTALIVMASVLLAATGRLLLRRRSLELVYLAHVVLSTFATAATVWLIWSDGGEDWWARVVGTAWILTGLTWALVPVLGRTTRGSTERVVGRGPGRVEVELAEGETLVVRTR
jgi:ascorbate-specific PTS system EIIC-type component UlaA